MDFFLTKKLFRASLQDFLVKAISNEHKCEIASFLAMTHKKDNLLFLK